MANRITRGTALVGNLAAGVGFSGFAIGSGLVINPETSAVGAQSVEERSYTTGLTALSLITGDFVQVHPKTALASGLGIGWVRVGATNTLNVGWTNASAGASTPSATTYDLFVIHRFPKT